jgi:hypothetical protein
VVLTSGRPGQRDDSWRVRVYGADGTPRGAGILLPDNLVLTCAHVVDDALDGPAGGPRPLAEIRIDFPGSRARRTYQARVTADGWFPADPDGGQGDLAVLVIEDPVPPDVRPAQIRTWKDSAPASVAVFGHPAPLDDGVWATAQPKGRGGPGSEWVQIDGVTVPGERVRSGFSGAGVIDEETGAVIGVVVAEHQLAVAKIAWMLPVEIVVRYWAPLAGHVQTDAADRPGASAAETPAPPKVALRDRQRLSAAILRLPGMQSVEHRNRCLREVELECDVELSAARVPEPPVAVWELLRVCLERPGRIRVLADVLRGFYPDSTEMADLDRLVEVLFPDPLLEDADRTSLRSLLTTFETNQIAKAFRYAVGGEGIDLHQDWYDTEALLLRLESLIRPAESGPPPILMFVDYLAHLSQLGGAVGQSVEMHVWLDAVGAQLGHPVVLRQLCRQTVNRLAASRCYRLLLELRPDRIDPHRHLLSIWLYPEDGEPTTLLRDDRPRLLTEVNEELERALETVPDLAGGPVDELTVEFLVPRELLNHPVEEWALSTFPKTLGIRYPVVVRSLDRLRDQASHAHWRRKWQWLCDNGQQHHASAVYWHPTGTERSTESLYVEFVRADHLVGLAVPFGPDRVEDGDHDPFSAGLSAGIPVMVWCRDPRAVVGFTREIHDRLAGRGLADLPMIALELRREARMTNSATHPGRHLGLLWDDAHHFPRPIRLRAPGPE